MTFKNMKFRVKDAEHSRKIQEKLTKLGYTRRSVMGVGLYDRVAFLFTCDGGSITWTCDAQGYDLSENEEYTLEQLEEEILKQKLTPAQKLGYKIGDEFEVIANNTTRHNFKIGDIVTLHTDDGTTQPEFRKIDSDDEWYCDLHSEVKPIKKSDVAHIEGGEREIPDLGGICEEGYKIPVYENGSGMPYPFGDAMPIKHIMLTKRKQEQQTKHNHYFRPCPYESIDPYRIIEIYGITDPCFQHVLKKVLAPGDRGHKDVAEDVQNIIDTMERWKKMRAEEQALENSND